MLVDRRKVLKILAMAFVTATAIGGFFSVKPSFFQRLARHSGSESGNKSRMNTVSGTGDASVMTTLLKIAGVLVMSPIRAEHYEAYFRWRAQNMGGYKNLYEGFTQSLNQCAKKISGTDFINCDDETKEKVFKEVIGLPPDKKASVVSRSKRKFESITGLNVFDRKKKLYRTKIVLEILALFARTDAYLILGYESWPGTPIGLSYYRHRPRETFGSIDIK